MKNTMTKVFYAQRGNNIIKKELFENYKYLIYKICKKYCITYPYIFIWDEIENDGLKVFDTSVQKYSFDQRASFATFLALQLKYCFSTQARLAFTNKMIASTFAISKDYTEYTGSMLSTNKYNPSETILDKDLYNRYTNALPDEEKELIILWSQSFSYKEIAQIKNQSVKWVDNKVRYTLKKLRKLQF